MQLDDMALFVRVVETGSFTKTADLVDMPKSTVSRRIRNLEQHLQSRLLERTTRKVVLTEVGSVFYQKCLSILEQVSSVQQEISHSQQESVGNLTIYAPDYILELCIDQVSEFCRCYPGISLRFHNTSQPLTAMSDKRFDLLIDIGEQPDSSFIAKPICDVSFSFFAHPDYLQKHGVPTDLKQLSGMHKLIAHELPSQEILWNHERLELPDSPKYVANSPYIVRALTLEAQGIGCLPVAMISKELAAGELVELFDGQSSFQQTIYAIYHSRRFVPQKVKVLIETIKNEIPNRIKAIEHSVFKSA
ncbi:LysR family transcriptional regulator [Vibrio sp. Of7-15]|uniref:LysR family transcriptional regulator n=1 Tax=Vibrio sp. Of7-15 TaxID=2724879 RepID=UPI001EF1B590|nr:LysR family transcriptional regulator [Vibrio sp. Of7-15]MCG7499574.1 LysR family transcriptional regulator [Vibrio sp. Of7-15]